MLSKSKSNERVVWDKLGCKHDFNDIRQQIQKLKDQRNRIAQSSIPSAPKLMMEYDRAIADREKLLR